MDIQNNINQTVNSPLENNNVPAPITPKKKINTPAIILGITTAIFAVAAIFFGIPYFTNGKKDDQQPNTNLSPSLPDDEIEVITIETMAEQYKDVKDVIENLTSGIENNLGNYVDSGDGNGLTYMPENLNTYIPMKFALQIKINNSDSGEANAAILQSRLSDADFSSIGILPFLGSAGIQKYGYLKDDVVCSVYSYTDWQTIEISHEYAVLSCAKTDWVWLTEEEKELVGELETAYHDKTGQYPRTLNVHGYKIQNSQYEPYQTLQVGLGGGAGLFYRADTNSRWQFFTVTQAVLECSDYDTDDLKKAFFGDPCYNGQEQTTVQL